MMCNPNPKWLYAGKEVYGQKVIGGSVGCWSLLKGLKMKREKLVEEVDKQLRAQQIPGSQRAGMYYEFRIECKSFRGIRQEVGFLTPKDWKEGTSKGGLKNGVLVLRPTLPQFDHEKATKLRRKEIPIKRIRKVQVFVY